MLHLSRHTIISRIYQPTSRGFSILMAISTIGVLLIVITGLATTYIREMKLSRTTYDEVIAYANAEGMFEYAMLKARNHREGFADSVENSEPDGTILVPTSARSRGLTGLYVIDASTTEYDYELMSNEHLIIPLFASDESLMPGGALSKNPSYNPSVAKTENLAVNLGNLSWTIVAMSGSESIGLTGSGDISPTKLGTIRHKTSQCYDRDDGSPKSCSFLDPGDEELQYFYDEDKTVSDFISDATDAYLMVYNDGASPQDIHITADTLFTLPTLTVRAESQKNDSIQVFQFTEDKSKYYDALKYGVYNAD